MAGVCPVDPLQVLLWLRDTDISCPDGDGIGNADNIGEPMGPSEREWFDAPTWWGLGCGFGAFKIGSGRDVVFIVGGAPGDTEEDADGSELKPEEVEPDGWAGMGGRGVPTPAFRPIVLACPTGDA